MLELENHSTTQTDRQVPEDETTFSDNQPGYASRETQISLANTNFNDVSITHGQGCQIIYDADQGIYKIIADGHPLAASSGYDCNQSLTNGQNENTDTIMHGQALASSDNQNPTNDQNSQTIIDADQSKFGHSVDGSHPFASDDHDENLSPANDHSVNIDIHTPNDDQALASSLGGITWVVYTMVVKEIIKLLQVTVHMLVMIMMMISVQLMNKVETFLLTLLLTVKMTCILWPPMKAALLKLILLLQIKVPMFHHNA